MQGVVSTTALQHLACSVLLILCSVALIFVEVTQMSTARIGYWSGILVFLPAMGAVVATFSGSQSTLILILLLDLTGLITCAVGIIVALVDRMGNPIAIFWLEFAALLFLVYELALVSRTISTCCSTRPDAATPDEVECELETPPPPIDFIPPAAAAKLPEYSELSPRTPPPNYPDDTPPPLFGRS
ncbi:hypothetical protein SprV_0401528500 [Sparganum proliferum]